MLPFNVKAAQILQVKSSSLIQIGDNNRNYTIKLACVEVESENDQQVKDWLNKNLPRGQKINLLPEASEKGILQAKVIKLGTNKEINRELQLIGLANYKC